MFTRKDGIITGIAIIALGVGCLALGRREYEIQALKNVEKMLSELKTAYRFAEIVDQYHQSQGDTDDTSNPPGDS